jgi:AmmeMemoRadiSam system protein B
MLYSYASDRPEAFERFARSSPELQVRTAHVRSAIVPHHLLAGPHLWGFFRALSAAAPGVRHIVILGPDHFAEELPLVILSDLLWKTPFGMVRCDTRATSFLASKISEARILSAVHNREHSISSIIPFAASFFPGAEVSAIIVKPWLDPSRAAALGEALSQLSPDTLVILSSDFVHYKSKSETEAIDSENERLILSQFRARNPDTDKIQADCRRGLSALFTFNRLCGVTGAEKILYTNSHTLTGKDEPGTSYFFYVFGSE